MGSKGFRATVKGTQAYEAELAWRGSGLSKKCTCPISGGRNPCKHLIALAIVADQLLGIPPPDAEEVEAEAIPPPLIDDSEGVHRFGEAHLQVLIEGLRSRKNFPESVMGTLTAIERGFRE